MAQDHVAQGDAADRGIALALDPNAPTIPARPLPPSSPHYENGPLTYRQFIHNGSRYSAKHEAGHDGTGWLVWRTTYELIAPQPGDIILVRYMVEENHGDYVRVRYAAPGREVVTSIPCGLIVFLEKARAA